MNERKLFQNGITLIALVISIIVMLILAGVSLNATIGDNGIITQAQNATYMQSIAALEEYLQTEYVKYYDETENYTSKIELLSSKLGNLCLKDGTKNYITYDGKMYYLINKQALPDEVKNQLKGGDTTEYLKYIRLQDVYGVTPDLKVYYCESGTDNAIGNINETKIDPNTPLAKIKNNASLNEAIKDILTENGVTVGENGITYGNVSTLKELTIDGSKYQNMSSLQGLSELTSLRKLNLKDLEIEDINEVASCTLLSYIKFQNCTVKDYTALASSTGLEYLYLYNPTSNTEVENLSNALADSNLNKLQYFGIFGYEPERYSYSSSTGMYTAVSTNNSNITDISSLNKISANTKNAIKYMYLNNNKITNIESLKDFSNINLLYLMGNSNLSNLNGLENHTNLKYIYSHNCGIEDITGLTGCNNIVNLTLQNNKISSFAGLENANTIDLLYAYNNNLADISALNGKSSINTLNLKNNVNLIEIKSIATLSNVKYLYLADNINMNVADVQSIEKIISKCSEYTIPDKYLKYFSTATQYDYTNSGLNDYSEEILALKNRTNVTYLRLYGNSDLGKSRLGSLMKQGDLSTTELDIITKNLSLSDAEKNIVNLWKNYSDTQIKNMTDNEIINKENENDIYIRYVLSTMTGLNKLSIAGIGNITSVDFIKTVKNLEQLDLRDTIVTDLTILEKNALKLDTLAITNPNIKMKDIQNTINRLGSKTVWDFNIITNTNTNRSYAGGLILIGSGFEESFKGCGNITKLICYEESLNGKVEQTIDLSDCISLNTVILSYTRKSYILPNSSISYLYVKGDVVIDATKCVNLTGIQLQQVRNFKFDTFSSCLLKAINIQRGNIAMTEFSKLTGARDTLETVKINTDDWGYYSGGYNKLTGDCNSLINFKNLKNLSIYYYYNKDIIKGISQLTSLEKLDLNTNNIGDISELANLTNLKELTLHSNNISDLSALSNLRNLTYLYLYANSISNLKPLESLIVNGKTNLQTLYLHNNTLENYTTQNINGQVSSINNIEILKKLHDAGLKNVNIAGNNFQDTSELKKLTWTSYAE